MGPTSLELQEKGRYRKWGRLHYHGPLCWWCLRMASVRYAWRNVPSFVKFLCAAPENQVEAALASVAYVSLREEGRAQVSASMIQSRVALFTRLQGALPAILTGQHWRTIPLNEFKDRCIEEFGNPIEQQYEICELQLDGARRLGVKIPAPRPTRPTRPAILERANMGPFVASSDPEDFETLASWAQQAPLASRMLPGELPPPATDDSPTEPGLAAGASSSADPEGGETQSPLVPWTSPGGVIFLRGRIGSGMQRVDSTLQGIVLNLGKVGWRSAIKDTILRGLQRAAAGLEKELLQSEYPALVELNSEHLGITQNLLDFGAAVVQFDKDEKVAKLVAFKKPLDALEHYKDLHFSGASSFKFDAELIMLLARRGNQRGDKTDRDRCSPLLNTFFAGRLKDCRCRSLDRLVIWVGTEQRPILA